LIFFRNSLILRFKVNAIREKTKSLLHRLFENENFSPHLS
jgi:hypothetical protein